MRRRFAAFLIPVLLCGLAPAASAQSAAAVVQRIHDQAYAKCMTDARFGAGPELQENCSCSADVVVSLLSDDFKHAIADGTYAAFKGPKLKGDAAQFNATLLATCPKMGAYLK